MVEVRGRAEVRDDLNKGKSPTELEFNRCRSWTFQGTHATPIQITISTSASENIPPRRFVKIFGNLGHKS